MNPASTLDPPGPAPETAPVERALISVSDKTGLAEFADGLAAAGVELFSTGGTRRFLAEQGIKTRDVAEYTGFPEMMDGRVKTLHPLIFGGILARRDVPDDLRSAAEHGILKFDLVVVNLYPFAAAIAQPDAGADHAIENIDIGGPSLVRAAAKNSRHVTVVTSPQHYTTILDQLREGGGTSAAFRQQLMYEAFEHTARYDRMIADWCAQQSRAAAEELSPLNESTKCLPTTINLQLARRHELRYGENPHQVAALYDLPDDRHPDHLRLADARQLNGKELSYNNWLDLDAALTIASSFEQPACVVIKHNNPCGAAIAKTLRSAVELGMAGDPVSAFGSVLAVNRELDVDAAQFLAEGDFFVECLVAPGFLPQALEILTTRPRWKKNVRLLESPLVRPADRSVEFRQVTGGLLVQTADDLLTDASEWRKATAIEADAATMRDLVFAWTVVRFVKSNAIVLARDGAVCGVGAGQMSRVDSVNIAIEKAGDRVRGSVMASDAFFPFPDSVEQAAAAGVRAIVQPGGSVNDEAVIEAARHHGIAMLLTSRRHFRH